MRISIVLLGCLLLLMVACDYDQALEPTVGDNCENVIVSYENGVEELIERTCAYDGCHVTGFSSGDYTSYESIIPFLEDIENRTLRVQDMPPDYSPDGKAKSLTADEIQLLSCWIADGAPEQ